MNRDSRLVAGGAIAACVACLSLLALAFIARPPFAVDQFAVLTGTRALSDVEAAAYLSYLKKNLTIDSFYLLAHIGMWFGYAAVLKARGVRLGGALLALGLIGAVLDFVENEMRWVLATDLSRHMASPSWGVVWQIVVGMSFWLLLMAAVWLAISIWSARLTDRAMSAVSLGCLIGVATIYAKGYLVTFLWMIIWHAAGTIYLWRESLRLQVEKDLSNREEEQWQLKTTSQQ